MAGTAVQELSQARAQAVVIYLTAQDVAASRLAALGLGETAPPCGEFEALAKVKGRRGAKALQDCRKLNRRVQFRITSVNGTPVAASDSVTVEEKKAVP